MKRIYSKISIIIIICLVTSVLCSCDLITTDKDKFILKEFCGEKVLTMIDLEKTGPDIVVPEKVGDNVIDCIYLANPYYSKIDSIDVSNVKELYSFSLYLFEGGRKSKLKKLDFSKNEKLRYVDVSDAKALSKIIFNKNCESISLFNNASIKELDLKELRKLESLTYLDGPLEEIDLSNNPSLQQLDVWNVKVEEIDLSNNPDLRYLRVVNTKVKTIDVSNNPKLEHIKVNEGMEIIGDTNAEIEYYSKEDLEKMKEN